MQKFLLRTFVAGCFLAAVAISANGQKAVTQDGVTYVISRVGVGADDLAARIRSVSDDVKGSVVIPERLDTLMKFSGGQVHPLVVGIENGAFQGNRAIESLTLPASLKEFPDSAFKNCTSLVSVKVPGMSGTVPESCFYRCTSLSGINLPSGVRAIGGSAFMACTSMKSVVFPEALDSIGRYAFAYVPLKELNLPSTVSFIGYAAFAANSELKSVEFPDSMRLLSGFNYCTSLSSVRFPRKLDMIGNAAFEHCTSLISISLPEELNIIWQYAFSNCTGLTEVTVPESVYNLAGFDYCTNLGKINLPKNLLRIGIGAFAHCPLLDRERLEIPEGVKMIAPYAFEGWTKLKEVVLPESTHTVGGFNECVNLRSINLDKVVALDDFAFVGCVNLFGETMELPDSMKYLSQRCFANLTQVKKVKLPEGIKLIAGFNGCTGLTEISIPTKEEIYIDFDAFNGCTGLTEITIPSNVYGIGGDAFSGCASLRSVTFEDGEEELIIATWLNNPTALLTPKKGGALFIGAPVEYLHIGRYWIEGRYVIKTTGEKYDVEPLAGLTTLKTLELGPTVEKLPSLDCAANKGLQTIKSKPLTPPVVNEFSNEQYANVTLWIPYKDFRHRLTRLIRYGAALARLSLMLLSIMSALMRA